MYSIIFIEKATFTWVWLKRFSAEQQFYGNTSVGKVWLKCIWQSLKTDLIEGNACQPLEPWATVVQSPQMLQTFLGAFFWLTNGKHLESNNSAEQAYSVVVLHVSGTLCWEWLYCVVPNPMQVIPARTHLKIWAGTQKGWEMQWHDVPPRMNLIPDARLSLTPGIASGSTRPIFSTCIYRANSSLHLRLKMSGVCFCHG